MTTATVNPDDIDLCVTAAAHGDLSMVKSHLDSTSNVSTAMGAMLCTAAYHGHLPIVELLLAKGTDVNTNVDGDTALLAAVRGGKAEICQVLITNGADVYARCHGDSSALHSIPEKDPLTDMDAIVKIIDQLLANGLSIESRNDEGHTVLHEAALYGRVDLINELIDRGANIEAKNKWQDTPLDRACLNGHTDAVKVLLMRGAEINAHAGGCEGLRRASRNGDLALLSFLLDNGAKGLPNSAEEPELLSAARSDVPEVVQLLLNRGYSSQGPKCLLKAVVTDSVDVVTQLVSHGVDVTVKNKKRQTLLHLAVLAKRMERIIPGGVLNSRDRVVSFLLDQDIDVNARDIDGKTALDIAIDLGYGDICKTINMYRDK